MTILGEVTRPRGVKVKPSEMAEAPFIGLESVEAHTMRLLAVGRAKDVKSSGSYFERGDVLYGRLRPYLNKVHMPNFGGLASGEFIVFPNGPSLDNAYLKYFLNQWEFASFATRLNAGDRPRVDFSQLAGFPFPLAPLPEQHRIVAEIEKQLTRLDASVAALERVRANLKRYRASVLKTACEGRLVPTEAEVARAEAEVARAENRGYEPAGRLLERILAERRAASTPSPSTGEGRGEGVPKPKRRGKYKEPAPPDTSTLPDLPEGWVWASVEQLIIRSEYGTSKKCDYEARGVPVLRIPNIIEGEIDLEDMKYAQQFLQVDSLTRLQTGDVLMCRTNGSIRLIGKTAVVRAELEPRHSFASYLLRFRFAETQTTPNWFHIFVNSQSGRAFIEQHAASSAGQHNVSLRLIHGMPIPIPPLAEQRRIVAEVERRLSVVQQAETAVEAGLKRAGRLRQSILKRAFSGKLVPQDPADEPASALLERIRAERAAAEAAAKAQRKTKRPRSKRSPASTPSPSKISRRTEPSTPSPLMGEGRGEGVPQRRRSKRSSARQLSFK